jgi:glycogen debranching enzyme
MLVLHPLPLAAQTATPLRALAITVTGPSREFAYTNKKAAFLYGETNGEQRSSWQGFNVWGREMLDGYSLLIDGVRFSAETAERAVVFPDHLERHYRSGVVEEVRPVDSLDLFAVVVRTPAPAVVTLVPWLTDVRRSEDLLIDLRADLALVARKTHLETTPDGPSPRWLAVAGEAPLLRVTRERGRFSPVQVTAGRSRTSLFVIAAAREANNAALTARRFAAGAERAFSARQHRIERLLTDAPVRTDNASFNKALAWAMLSLDALSMEQGKPGIFAGLPWFNNYWGRDTFIALPGAALVTGRFQEARAILLSFADEQERDTASTNFGRIPNFVTPSERAYNTADGTPRLIMMARDYIERSGDRSLLPPLYPVVVRSIEGTRRYHTDSLGFLTHADAETWMDAVGPDGPWSPRGNRANDIQALWAGQLESGIWFATQVGDVQAARTWTALLHRLRESFSRFIVTGKIADRLSPDGTPDLSLRPNQIFTAPLLNEDMRAAMLRTVVTSLTYTYGVASLSEEDDNFHPYHQYPPYYPKDAAYHNGTVWTWLQGPVISELCRAGEQNIAWNLTANSVHQILDRGAVGTQSELLDALPRPGQTEPGLSGTFSQAWNLAEFIRNFYDDYLGLRVSLLDRTIRLHPIIPDSLGDVNATLSLAGERLSLRIAHDRGRTKVELGAGSRGAPWRSEVGLRVRGGRLLVSYRQPPGGKVMLSVGGDSLLDWKGCQEPPRTRLEPAPTLHTPLRLAVPHLREDLPCLRGPLYRLLNRSAIKKTSPRAALLAERADPEGDDAGILPGEPYTYPENPLFVPGAFDITSFRVRYDSTDVYFRLNFRALADPGWHPEYGFQLTFVAIAIDTGAGSGERIVPQNASFSLPAPHAYDRLVLIGGGVRVEDARGNILAAYLPVPEDISDPLGDAASGVIEFALPRSVLGDPSGKWHFTVLAGAQDDHGGAGLGEFRTVNRTRGEWNGGGKLRPENPNVYDMLEAGADSTGASERLRRAPALSPERR